MALKPDRHILQDDISFFMNETGNRGGIVVFSTFGSGASMDDTNAKVAYPGATVSGTVPAGLLLNDVVDYDLTKQHRNFYQDQVQKGQKVAIMTKGWVVTNNITGTPAVGSSAYYDLNGNLGPDSPANGTQVGRFLSAKDADGYAKVQIDL